MTWLSDTTPLVADGWLSSAYAGHGIRGADVPSSGANGPAILYPGLVLPDEANDQVRALILTRPATLPGLVIYEDSSLDTGDAPPDGVHVGTWRGYKNGQIYGPDPSTYTITIGSAGGTLTGGATLDGPGAGGALSGGAPSVLSGGATLDGPAAAGGLGVGGVSQLGGGAVLDGPAAGGGLTSLPPATLGGGGELDGPGSGGSIHGGGAALPPLSLMDTMPRLVRAGRLAPRWLAPLDVAEVADIYFDFTPGMQAADRVVAVAVTCEARTGTDAAADQMLLGQPVFDGTRAVQRIQPGVLGNIYLLRAVATLASGQLLPAAGFLRVRRLQ